MIKLKILRWEDYLGLSGEPYVISEALISESKREESEAEEI